MTAITKVEILPLRAGPNRAWDCDGTYEVTLVRVWDENGRYGIGEINGSPMAAHAFIGEPSAHIWSQNLGSMVLGKEPADVVAIWQLMYDSTIYSGRRGAGLSAISGIDIALHDLAGKQLDLPVYRLLGGARQTRVTPYATIFPGMPNGRSIEVLMSEITSKFQRAKEIGFKAVKMEVMFEDLVDDQQLVHHIREGRQLLGDEVAMAVDFGYRWNDWRKAAWVIDQIADCRILFAEAALQHDDLAGHSKLAGVSKIPICGAELAVTKWEIKEWIEHGEVDVVQPCITRAGGFTEMRRISNMCELSGTQCIPHGWVGGVGAHCQLHLQAISPNMPYVEYLSPELYDSPLRRDLVGPEPTIKDGAIALPTRPGLGIEVNEQAIQRYLAREPAVISA